MHKTAAWPLALIFAALVVYASLYPFADWRDQGIAPWAFLYAPVPRYWTGFDVAINVVGYSPLGGLVALAVLRSGGRYPVWIAVGLAGLVSLAMETSQGYLPMRVPSREDWLLNLVGAWAGAAFTLALERLGGIARWSRIRERWLVAHSRGAVVLLALWPAALLFPPPVPFGLGQVFERVEAALAQALAQTPFLEWLPVRDVELQPLVPAAEMICSLLGLLIPCLLGFCIVRSRLRRLLLVPMVLGLGMVASVLSAAMSWGPLHAWAWLDLPVQAALVVALLVGMPLALLSARASAALLLLALGLYLGLLNQAPESPYFAQTLQDWEQGRFIRFHGLAQWLGWLWPYAVLVYVMSLVGRRDLPT